MSPAHSKQHSAANGQVISMPRPHAGETELLPNAFGLPEIEVPTARAPEVGLREVLVDIDEAVMLQMHKVPTAESLHETANHYQEQGKTPWLIDVNRQNARLVEEDPRLYIAANFFQDTLRTNGTKHWGLGQYREAVRVAIKRAQHLQAAE